MRTRLKLTFILILTGLFIFSALAVQAGQSGSGSVLPMSFIVLGDNRLPGYLKFQKDDQEGISNFAKQNWGKELVNMQYDHERYLEYFELCKEGQASQECRRVWLKDGWPDKIVEPTWTPRLILRGDGQPWVYGAIAREAKALKARNLVVLHSGDMIYNGYYGYDPENSPYWRRIEQTLLNRLPKGAPVGLPGRFFPTMGNHETWMDPDIMGVLNTIPYLKEMDVSKTNHMYDFTVDQNLFIFLDTGGYPPKADWSKTSMPGYDDQMANLTALLDQAVAGKKIANIFITLHKPPFVGSGHGHLSKANNPHTTLEKYGDKLDITVFSGHVHTTEVYFKDNIRYFVLGGGGADQAFKKNCEPGDYYCSDELYWRGAQRVLEYNFMTVTTDDKGPDFVLSRWRPATHTPYEQCEFFTVNGELTFHCRPAPELNH